MKIKITPYRFTVGCGIAGLLCVGLTIASFVISGNPNNWGGIPFFLALLFKALAILGVCVQILKGG